ncbi:MAG TPA: pyridoxal-phosphate dependent enzyme [Chitinophagaceae bacterium]
MYDQPIQIQRLNPPWCRNIHCEVLRLDQIHPVVSGNKWFKLRYYLADAKASGCSTIATFGGAWSNHLVATAFACREAGLRSLGIVRGEAPAALSSTLRDAMAYGMELVFVSRTRFHQKDEIKNGFGQEYFWVDEGGYGIRGMEGAAGILDLVPENNYSHIICACGTGTTLAGLVQASAQWQHCVGITVLKGHTSLAAEVNRLVVETNKQNRFTVVHDYHFGGYAKHPPELLEWMNDLWRQTGLPTDIVYTGKLLFAVKDLIQKQFFDSGDKLLIIHSGGLQGNRSLPEGTLEFS